jgi:hypothetical protein
MGEKNIRPNYEISVLFQTISNVLKAKLKKKNRLAKIENLSSMRLKNYQSSYPGKRCFR